MRKNEAQNHYKDAVNALVKYCDEQTDLTPVILDQEYPFQVQFVPDPQQTLFGNDNVDMDTGEIRDLTVTVGLTTSVKSTLKFKMDSKQLKKLIKLAEALGHLYYQAFREEAGDSSVSIDDTELKEKLIAAMGEGAVI